MLKLLFVIVLFVGSGIAVLGEPRPYFTEPSLSPDRKEIAFVSGGDIWTVPAVGGVASLLVSHSANEARPLYSPGMLKPVITYWLWTDVQSIP